MNAGQLYQKGKLFQGKCLGGGKQEASCLPWQKYAACSHFCSIFKPPIAVSHMGFARILAPSLPSMSLSNYFSFLSFHWFISLSLLCLLHSLLHSHCLLSSLFLSLSLVHSFFRHLCHFFSVPSLHFPGQHAGASWQCVITLATSKWEQGWSFLSPESHSRHPWALRKETTSTWILTDHKQFRRGAAAQFLL